MWGCLVDILVFLHVQGNTIKTWTNRYSVPDSELCPDSDVFTYYVLDTVRINIHVCVGTVMLSQKFTNKVSRKFLEISRKDDKGAFETSPKSISRNFLEIF